MSLSRMNAHVHACPMFSKVVNGDMGELHIKEIRK